MIRVAITQTSEGRIQSFTMDGHANFAEHGQDIVCAGASAVAFGSVNAILALTGIEPVIEQSPDGGFLCFQLPETLSEKEDEQVQLLLKGMVVSLETIERDYKKYMKLTFKQ
ncbi:ribosomal-processing cysteine protease Prp [Bacillus sp. 2205SS5-2]|uniref:ribosomal-processing cysteine protease Prp n=1 Tax=Bacillus sp. 2205SS5-2 TaxID=3109031 RepID=UPI003003D2D7